MTKSTRKVGSRDFLTQLKSGRFTSARSLTALVKEADDDGAALLVATDPSCAFWSKLPLETIEEIEVEDVVPCKDHAHPLVRITFKEPSSETESALLALALDLAAARDRALRMGYLTVARSVADYTMNSGITNADRDRCTQCIQGCRNVPLEDFFSCIARCGPVCPG